jgi:hypothetical protein
MSEDISYRQRRYLISMGVRVVAFLLAVFLFHGIWRFIAAAIALVVPYFAVVFANGGREPDNAAGFEPFEPNLPERKDSAAGPPAPADSAAADVAERLTTARDGIVRDGTAKHGSMQQGATRDGAPPDASAGGRTEGEGHLYWISSGEDPVVHKGETFLSGEQADSRL